MTFDNSSINNACTCNQRIRHNPCYRIIQDSLFACLTHVLCKMLHVQLKSRMSGAKLDLRILKRSDVDRNKLTQ